MNPEKEFKSLLTFIKSGTYAPGIKNCDEELKSRWTDFCDKFRYYPDTLSYDNFILRLYDSICGNWIHFQYAMEFDEFDDFMCELLI